MNNEQKKRSLQRTSVGIPGDHSSDCSYLMYVFALEDFSFPNEKIGIHYSMNFATVLFLHNFKYIPFVSSWALHLTLNSHASWERKKIWKMSIFKSHFNNKVFFHLDNAVSSPCNNFQRIKNGNFQAGAPCTNTKGRASKTITCFLANLCSAQSA